ncbi:hypothetical protein CFOL_v3_13392, partial [Cephalotus follicularis]
LKKFPHSWIDVHTQLIRQIKAYKKEIPCLYLASPLAFKIVETDGSDIGYGGILKQLVNDKEQLIQYTSGTCNSAQKNYATIKKEISAIVLCVQKFQSDLLNQKFLSCCQLRFSHSTLVVHYWLIWEYSYINKALTRIT